MYFKDRALMPADLQHELFLLTLDGKLHLSPTEDLDHVLDIGTGTGSSF